MVKIDIENIIASANLQAELELEEVTTKLANSEYNPERFPGVIYRSEDPKVVILVFKNGRMMCTAAKSLEDVEKVMNEVEGILKNAGMLDKKPQPEAKPEDKGEGEPPAEEPAPEGDAPTEEPAPEGEAPTEEPAPESEAPPSEGEPPAEAEEKPKEEGEDTKKSED
jgi:hypothetical protein